MKKILIFASALVFVMGTSLMVKAQNATTKTQPQKATTTQEHTKTAAKPEAVAPNKEVKATANATSATTAHVKTKHSKTTKTAKPAEPKK